MARTLIRSRSSSCTDTNVGPEQFNNVVGERLGLENEYKVDNAACKYIFPLTIANKMWFFEIMIVASNKVLFGGQTNPL